MAGDAGDDADDAALVAAMARGDRNALAALYERHAPILLGLALRIVRERREAEDLLHDVLLEAWKAAKDFDPRRGRVRTWLAIRMRSRALDLQKSARVSRNAGDAGLEVMVDDRETATPDHARVRTALAGLGADQRAVVELAYFQGLSCSEIAERIKIPIGTVKSRLAAGLAKLRDEVAGKDVVMTDIRELLPLYAMGALDENEAVAVERAVQADPVLAAELDAYISLTPAVTPSPDVKARLLASVGGGQYEPYAARMSKLLDVTLDGARQLLGLAERKASWETPIPGIHLVHFDGGPAYAAADCGFVRVDPGCTFPWHKHRGEEVSILLSGTVRDNTGKVWHPGDEIVQAEGTEHSLTAGDEGAMYVARAMNGIEVSGQRQ